jgi:hypothetical protein
VRAPPARRFTALRWRTLGGASLPSKAAVRRFGCGRCFAGPAPARSLGSRRARGDPRRSPRVHARVLEMVRGARGSSP